MHQLLLKLNKEQKQTIIVTTHNKDLAKMFSINYYTRKIDVIYKRVFK